MADRIRSSRPLTTTHSTTQKSVRNPRQFITSLIGAIPKPPPSLSKSLNPLKDDTPRAKNIFLALHVIFPNELLPALDVLDRGLVVRLCAKQRSPAHHPSPALLLVRSAQQQQRQQRSHNTAVVARNPAAEHVAYYEVRLDAWSCSCPTFAFSAFAEREPEPTGVVYNTGDADADDDDDGNGNAAASAKHHISPEIAGIDDVSSDFHFGGCSLGNDLPVCKHLLACVLVEHCAAFQHFAEEREVSEAELAGWAAGWGD